MTMENILNRKGARRAADVPEAVLQLLNEGAIPSVNLTEWLLIDHVKLLTRNFRVLGLEETWLETVITDIKTAVKPSAMSTIKLIGTSLPGACTYPEKHAELLQALISHPSDSIRCYAPYLIAAHEKWTLREKLEQALPLVADPNFGVREVVWMALRPDVAAQLENGIGILESWTSHTDANIRRFTTEIIRPRGVWCKHINVLKEKPEMALPILEALKSDPSRYVQDSVANWLNDAAKSQPVFVRLLGDRWLKESGGKETRYIVKRALRSIA